MRKLLLLSILFITPVHAKDNYHWILVDAQIDAVNGKVSRNSSLTGIANFGFHISGNYKDTKICNVTASICMFRSECIKKVYAYSLQGPIDIRVNDIIAQNISYPDIAKYETHTYVTNTCDTVTGRIVESFGQVKVV